MHKGVAPTLRFCLRVYSVAMTYGYGSPLVKLDHLVTLLLIVKYGTRLSPNRIGFLSRGYGI